LFSAHTSEFVLSGILDKYVKKIKACGENDLLSNSKKKSRNIPENLKEEVEKAQTRLDEIKEESVKHFRSIGNQHYKSTEYVKAHFFYTKSIREAVTPLSKAMGYANR